MTDKRNKIKEEVLNIQKKVCSNTSSIGANLDLY